MKKSKEYYFEEITHCEMCGDPSEEHKIIGQRLNQSQGFRPKRKGGISVSVKKCRKCQLLYSSPQPVPANIQDHYGITPESYWTAEYLKWTPDYFAGELQILRKIMDVKPGMKSLDVGAGVGKSILSLANAGFDAYGIEPSASFYERAVSTMNISPGKLRLGKMEDMDYPENFFDFISFAAVFEHLYHPVSCLEKAMHWLKPGGIIHIEVPSSRHLIAKLLNFYYKLTGTNYTTSLSPMHSPFHMYEFGYNSFTELSKKLGYKIVFHQFYVGDIYHIPRIFHFPLRQIMKWTDTGMQLTVWLKKEQ